MLVEECGIIEENMTVDGSIVGLRNAMEGGLVARQTTSEKVGGPGGADGHHVIIEIDEMLGEVGNAMKVDFEWVAGESG